LGRNESDAVKHGLLCNSELKYLFRAAAQKPVGVRCNAERSRRENGLMFFAARAVVSDGGWENQSTDPARVNPVTALPIKELYGWRLLRLGNGRHKAIDSELELRRK